MLSWGPRPLLWEQPGLWDAHCGPSIPGGLLFRRGKGAEHAAPRPPPRPSHALPHVLDHVAGPLGAWLRPPGLDQPGRFQAKIIAVTLFGQSLPVAPHQPRGGPLPPTSRAGVRRAVLLSPWEPTLLPGPPWGLGGAGAGSAAPLPAWSPGSTSQCAGKELRPQPLAQRARAQAPRRGHEDTCLALQGRRSGLCPSPHLARPSRSAHVVSVGAFQVM